MEKLIEALREEEEYLKRISSLRYAESKEALQLGSWYRRDLLRQADLLSRLSKRIETKFKECS